MASIEIPELMKLLAEARDTLHKCDEYCDRGSCLSDLLTMDTFVLNFIKVLKQKKNISEPLEKEYVFVFKELAEDEKENEEENEEENEDEAEEEYENEAEEENENENEEEEEDENE